MDTKEFTANLLEQNEGIHLTSPHGKMIWQGNKKLIVREKEFRNILDKNLYLVEGNYCYGIIKIKSVKSISLGEFSKLENMHRISDVERKRWWGNKRVLYAYDFEYVKRFENPKSIFSPKDETILESVKFSENFKENKTFKNIDECIKYIVGNTSIFKDTTITLEKKINGHRVLLKREGDTVNFLGTEKEFPEIKKEAKQLKEGDFILDGSIIDNILYVFDILKLDKTVLLSEEWKNRRTILHNLRFTEHIKEQYSMVLKDIYLNANQLKTGMFIFKNLNDSKGCIIKNWKSKYLDEWVEFNG